MNESIFLSHTLTSNTPSYGNNGKIEITSTRSISNGDTSNETYLSFTNHIGTHIDAPYHFDNLGKSLDEFLPSYWICNFPYFIQYDAKPSEVLELDNLIPFLEKIPKQTDLLILKTGFERYRNIDNSIYNFQNPSISPEIGFWMRKHLHLKFMGFDYISLSSRANRDMGRAAHKAFLCLNDALTGEEIEGSPILLIEDMKLAELNKAPKKVNISPMLYEKSDGAPAVIIAEL